MSSVWRQAIIWNNAGILSIGLLGTNFSEIIIEILTFSYKKMRLKVSSAKWRPFCLGLNVLRGFWQIIPTLSLIVVFDILTNNSQHIPRILISVCSLLYLFGARVAKLHWGNYKILLVPLKQLWTICWS